MAIDGIDLRVPFSDKDFAKELGAIWDVERKIWVAPRHSNLAKVSSWFPSPPIKPITPQMAWAALPPRKEDPKELMGFLGLKRPRKVNQGYCVACDSRIRDEWCYSTEPYCIEFRHLADDPMGNVRPTEMAIMLAALDEGSI